MSTIEDTGEINGVPERESERGSAVRGLGQLRWVQYVFVVIAVFLFWFLDKIITLTWQSFAEPSSTAVTASSALLAAVIALRLYKHEASNRLATEVVGELTKVTWPSRQETSSSTIVVIITSLIAAAIIGGFDFIWSAITDLLYKYKV